jgi:hypothetical protein
MKGDNSETVAALLHGLADAIENNRAEYSDYTMNDRIEPREARKTTVEVDIVGFDVGLVIPDGDGDAE